MVLEGYRKNLRNLEKARGALEEKRVAITVLAAALPPVISRSFDMY